MKPFLPFLRNFISFLKTGACLETKNKKSSNEGHFI
jgi:hypothetical protein